MSAMINVMMQNFWRALLISATERNRWIPFHFGMMTGKCNSTWCRSIMIFLKMALFDI